MTDSNTHTAAKAALGQTVYPVLFMVCAGHFLNDLLQSLVPAIYPIIKEDYGYSFTLIGIINLVYQLTSSILQPFVGLYIDKHKKPYLLACGMVFSLAGLLLMAVANRFGLILLAVSLIGCGSSIFHPESARIAQMASGGRKGVAQSIFQVGGYAGNSVGPLLAALIILPFGQSSISWFSVLACACILLLWRVGRWYAAQPPKPKPVATMTAGGHSLTPKQIRWAVVVLMLLIFTKYFYIAGLTSYYTFYLMDKFGLSVRDAQIFLFAFSASTAVGTVAGGAVGDRYGRKLVIWGSILGAAPFALALPYAGLWMTFTLAIIIGLVISSAFSAIVVYGTDLMPDKVGVISGAFYGLMFGLGGIGSAVLGWMADLTDIQTVFRLTSFLPLLGVIAFCLPNLKDNK